MASEQMPAPRMFFTDNDSDPDWNMDDSVPLKFGDVARPVPSDVCQAYWQRLYNRADSSWGNKNTAFRKNQRESGATYEKALGLLVADLNWAAEDHPTGSSDEKQRKKQTLEKNRACLTATFYQELVDHGVEF